MQHRVSIAVISCVCVSLAACDKPKPIAPKPKASAVTKTPKVKEDPRADTAWKSLNKNLGSTRLSSRKRLALLKGFVHNYGKSKYGDEAREMLKVMGTSSKTRRGALMASGRVHQSRTKAWSLVFASSVKDSKPQVYRDMILHGMLSVSRVRSQADSTAFKPIVLVSPSGEQHKVNRMIYMGLGSARNGVFRAIKTYFPSMIPKGCRYMKNSCFIGAGNALSQKMFGTPLYDKPASLNPKTVKVALGLLPDAQKFSMLGVPSQQLYQAYKPLVVALSTSLSQLEKKTSKAKALKAYKAAVSKNKALAEPDAYNKGMLQFYDDFAKQHGVDAVFSERPGYAYVYTGFWLRRMADGTDKMFASSLKSFVKAQDPALHKKLFK